MNKFCPKELSKEDLENVSGGISGDQELRKYAVYYYIANRDSERLKYELPGDYYGTKGMNQAKRDGKEWCKKNGYIFSEIVLINGGLLD